MRFTIQGRSHHLTADEVREALAGRRPGPVQTHWVAVAGIQWPIKQALEVCTGIYRAEFTTDSARRVFERLGFPVSQPPTERAPRRRPPPVAHHGTEEYTERAVSHLSALLRGRSLQQVLAELEQSLVRPEPGGLAEITHSPQVGGALIEYAMLARRRADWLQRLSEETAVLLAARAMLRPGERVLEPPSQAARGRGFSELRTTERTAAFVLGPLTRDNTVRQRQAVACLVRLILRPSADLAQLWVSDDRFGAFLSTCEQSVGWGLSRSPHALREEFEDTYHSLETPVYEFVNGPAADVEVQDVTELVPEAAAID